MEKEEDKTTFAFEEEEDEEVEEYDVDAVDDFEGEEAREVVVVTVVVIFASSHTTRMPRALLLFIHILSFCFVFARRQKRKLFKSKSPLCALSFSPLRKERVLIRL